MDSEDEHDHDGDHPDTVSSQSSVSLTCFLFGNIDEKGELEDDILDEDSKRHIEGLTILGMGSLVQEITSDVVKEEPLIKSDENNDKENGSEKSASAVDYFDIAELADEEEDQIRCRAALSDMVPSFTSDHQDDYDNTDTKLMPPPSWIPGHSPTKDSPKGRSGIPSESGLSPQDLNLSPGSRAKLNTPLADMLPPQLADKDVRELFPEFRPGQVLRFSRLFRPVYTPHVWKKKKKKKTEEEEKKTEKDVKAKDGKSETTPDQKTEDKNDKPEEKPQLDSDGNVVITDKGPVASEDNEMKAVQSIPEVEIKKEEVDQEEFHEESYWPYTVNFGRAPKPEELMPDDAVTMLQSEETKSSNTEDASNKNIKPEVAPWRYGPAMLWYDMLGVDESGEGFDYGFKMLGSEPEVKEENDEQYTEGGEYGNISQEADVKTDLTNLPKIPKMEYPDEAFHMVTQVHWEDDIIWNSEDVKQKILQNQKQKGAAAGWIATASSRTAQLYHQQMSGKPAPLSMSAGISVKSGYPGSKTAEDEGEKPPETWYSIFPIENDDLVYGKWEDDVIWDPENMQTIPEPPVLTLDPNDENIILAMPEDRDPSLNDESQMAGKKEKEVRKSKLLLSKAGMLKDNEEDNEEEDGLGQKDPFNISNDEYYNPKLTTDTALTRNLGGTLIQHSNPAVELRQPFFPTHLGPMKLRNFHRPPLKKYSHGPMASYNSHAVLPLLKQIKRKAKIREQERQASGGGDMFFMRSAEDLTGRDGEIILAEFSEEFPPLINRVGMATKMKNYYKRKPGKDVNPPQFEYGEIAYAHTSPFLGALLPGQCVQAFENNMYRAPVFMHKVPECDFLIIRNRQHYYIREVENMYTVGQLCPMIEVPGPNSKRANNFVRDFLQVFIYRLFLKSKDAPRRIKMEEIKKAYPTHSESSIRKRLKLCADFKRTGMDSNWWVLKSDFRLPTEEELRAMVSPEQCCAYYSMIAAEQRLKDAGYGEKSLFAPEDENEEDVQMKMDDEVRVAPWNTTRAYIAALKGKCLLSLTGIADPTGCGEGFCYMKVPNKPATTKGQQEDQAKDTPQKKTVTGTDADLRRLSLKDAKQLLKKFGVPEAEIKKLSRWEVIDVVRTMSTEQAKSGQEGMSKFARGNRFSTAEHQERYKEECQRIFDLQNKVLSSNEVLSTDEESSSGDDSDFEEMGKNIENMLSNKKSSAQIQLEKEEEERRELQRMLRGEDFKDKKKEKKENQGSPKVSMRERKLKITRTFRDETGREYTRTEIVRKPAVIDTYVRIRQSKDPQFIRQFSHLDDAQKEEMKKEKRRLQEQLRRIKKNQDRVPIHTKPIQATPPKKKKKEKQPVKTNLKCGACGQVGHMRTNKECPMYNKSAPQPSIPVAVTEEQEEDFERANIPDQNLTKVDGTKVVIAKSLVKHVDAVKRKSLVLKFPKVVADNKKRRRVGTIIHCDYLKKPKKSSNRRRTDPVVTLSTVFENIVNEMREIPNTQPFLVPVNPKQVPDYHRIVKKPMDLQTIRESIRNRKYLSRESFLMDVTQIVRNSEIYNGAKSVLTLTAQRMCDICLQRVAEKEDKLMRLEKAINPLLDDNDLVAFSFILATIVEDRLKTIDNSYIFHNPVNKKFVKDYYDIIKYPMDLNTLLKNVHAHKYKNQEKFLEDVALIVKNSEKYNGMENTYTDTAKKMYEIAKQALSEQEEQVNQLEENIRETEEAALEAAETDSIMTGTSFTGNPDDTVGDLESLDSMGVLKDVTIAEDNEYSMRPHQDMNDYDQSQSIIMQNTSRDDEYVDIEGEGEYEERMMKHEDSNDLADDLRITPENSEDEDADPYSAKLSSSGSDSDREDSQLQMSSYMERTVETDQSQAYTYDENAQDFSYEESSARAIQEMDMQQFNDEDSFDPGQFFTSYPQQERNSNQGDMQDTEMVTDIHTDLQVSESDSESDEEFVAVEEESNQDMY